MEQEHSKSADLRHGSSIHGLSKPTITTDIASPHFIFLLIVIRITPNLFLMDPDSDPDYSLNLIICSLSHLGHILKISSKSVHNFLSYLFLKITFHGSKRYRWSGSLPKSNHFFLLPFQTHPENFIKIRPSVFELSCSQTNRWTNPGENITPLAEVITLSHL